MRPAVLLHAVVVIATLVGTAFPAIAAEDIKPLEKETAAKLYSNLGYNNVTVGAVVQGIGGRGTAVALGVATRDGREAELKMTFFYDRELGWFCYEFSQDRSGQHKVLRLWTVDGYREIKPGQGKPGGE